MGEIHVNTMYRHYEQYMLHYYITLCLNVCPAAPGLVTNLTAYAQNHTFVVVTWFLPRRINGLINKFAVKVKHARSGHTVRTLELNAEEIMAGALPHCNVGSLSLSRSLSLSFSLSCSLTLSLSLCLSVSLSLSLSLSLPLSLSLSLSPSLSCCLSLSLPLSPSLSLYLSLSFHSPHSTPCSLIYCLIFM